MRGRRWALAALLAVLLLLALIVLGAVPATLAPLLLAVVELAMYAWAAVTAGMAARTEKGGYRAGWSLLAAGSWFAVAGILVAILAPALVPPAVLTLALQLIVYGLGLTGLLLMVPSGLRYQPRTGVLIDGGVAAASTFCVFWVFLAESIRAGAQIGLLERISAMAYPLLGMVALTITVVAAAWAPTALRASFKFLVASMAVSAAFIPVLAYLTLRGSIAAPLFGILVVVLVLSLQVLAALRTTPAETEAIPKTRGSRTQMVPYIPFVAGIAAVVWDYTRDGALDPILFAMSVAAVVLLLARLLTLVLGNVQVTRQLEESAEFRTQMLRFISHEMANPLTPISIQAYAMKQRQANIGEQENRNLEVFVRSVQRLEVLSKDLRDLARLDAGQLTIQPVDADVAKVTAAAVQAIGPVAERKRIHVDFDAYGATIAKLDAERFGQIVDNLLSNAVKFTPEGGRVEVRVRGHAGGVEVVVRDTGAGLSPAQQEALFKPFSRGHGSKVPGLGLGLFISKGIVEAHGGRIWAESAGPQRGASFHVDLPTVVSTVTTPSAS